LLSACPARGAIVRQAPSLSRPWFATGREQTGWKWGEGNTDEASGIESRESLLRCTGEASGLEMGALEYR